MYLQWLHLQSDSSWRRDRNSTNWARNAAVWGQRICQVSNHHQFFPSSRSNPKVSGLLCDFQRTLQILVKEFTPGNQTFEVFNIRAHTPCLNWHTKKAPPWFFFIPDRHFQRIERVLEGVVRVDLIDFSQKCVDARLTGVGQDDKLYPLKKTDRKEHLDRKIAAI